MPTRGAVVRRWRKRAAAHRAARAVSQSRLPRRPGPGTPLEWNAEFDGVWRHVFHALVRDGLMQRTAARVGCVGGLEVQRQAAHSGLCMCVKRSRGPGGRCFAMLRLANSPEQTHQRDQRQRCPSSHPGAASRAGGVSALSSSVEYASQMTAHRCRQGAGGHRHGAQAGRAGGALAHYRAGQAPNRARRCVLCPAVDWAPPTGGCRVSYSPHARWQMAAALATAGGRLVGGPERPQKPFITKARHSTPKPTAES